MPVHIVRHLFAGEVREAGTVGRTHFVDGTHIGLEIQELAGVGGIHPVAYFIQVKPFLLERRGGHAQVRRNALDVAGLESGRHFLAAVRAGQAIHFRPNFFVEDLGQLIQFTGRIFFDFGQKATKTGFVFGYFLPEGTEVDRFHAMGISWFCVNLASENSGLNPIPTVGPGK